jgi:uncharacterized protein YgiM (DUF1202 family)
MKPARVGLWGIGAAMCAISAGFMIDDFGRGDQPSEVASNPAQELAASVTAETPQSDELDVLDPAAQDSSHAIAPDTPQATPPSPPMQATAPSAEPHTPQTAAPSTDLPRPQATAPSAVPPVKEASPPVPSQPLAPANPSGDPSPTVPKELVTITSAAIIRNGPSSTADIIGRAHAGAKARVAATDSGWAQIVDPASGNKGWVESGVLAPSATTETAATDEPPDVAAADTLPEDQRAAMSENGPSATTSKHSAKAKQHRAKHHHARRRFAFRFVIGGLR